MQLGTAFTQVIKPKTTGIPTQLQVPGYRHEPKPFLNPWTGNPWP